MLLPVLLPRIEERDRLTGLRIDSMAASLFVTIACRTSKTEIVFRRSALPTEGDNVIDLAMQPRYCFGHLAIFAATLCPGLD